MQLRGVLACLALACADAGPFGRKKNAKVEVAASGALAAGGDGPLAALDAELAATEALIAASQRKVELLGALRRAAAAGAALPAAGGDARARRFAAGVGGAVVAAPAAGAARARAAGRAGRQRRGRRGPSVPVFNYVNLLLLACDNGASRSTARWRGVAAVDTGHAGGVAAVAFDGAEEPVLATAGAGGEVQFYNLTLWQGDALFTWRGSGKFVAAADDLGSVRIYARNGTKQGEVAVATDAHHGAQAERLGLRRRRRRRRPLRLLEPLAPLARGLPRPARDARDDQGLPREFIGHFLAIHNTTVPGPGGYRLVAAQRLANESDAAPPPHKFAASFVAGMSMQEILFARRRRWRPWRASSSLLRYDPPDRDISWMRMPILFVGLIVVFGFQILRKNGGGSAARMAERMGRNGEGGDMAAAMAGLGGMGGGMGGGGFIAAARRRPHGPHGRRRTSRAELKCA
ncbi:hypothetical protein SO694_00046276 [Aureococcus anophagefferens]|uniref:ER membrane protein complex subunit 7 beta-sandwich domain-containing protein n=1 Tax=Aureococcus anophagefferens TaxID=44056 RepID=A0ABR1G7G5_AURAN